MPVVCLIFPEKNGLTFHMNCPLDELCICVFVCHFGQSFCHIRMVSGCDRKLRLFYYNAASFKYDIPDTCCISLDKVIFFITKACLYNFDPRKPHFYIVKLGFTGVFIIFLISAQKHRLWVLVRTASQRRF